jgi:tetratricopeptide (TPR) repeat protein
VYGLLDGRASSHLSPTHLYAVLGLGLSRASRFEFATAFPTLDSARAEADALGDARAGVEARLALAVLAARSQGLDSARAILERAATLAPGDSLLWARTLCAQGAILRGQDLRRADTLSARGLRVALATANRRVIGGCLIATAQVQEAQGFQDISGNTFFRARDTLRSARDLYALASVDQWLAFGAIQFAANFWAGRSYALEAISEGRRTGNAAAEAWARLNLAQLAARFGDVPVALAYSDTAETLFTRIGDRLGLVALAGVRGQTALLDRRPAEALTAFRTVDSLSALLGITNARAGNALQMAVALRLRGSLDESAKYLSTADDAARRFRIPGIQNDVRYEQGLLSLARGAWDEAAASLASFIEHNGDRPWHLNLDANVRRAEALAHAGRFEEAEAAFDAGVISLARRRYTGIYNNREGQLALLQSRRYDVDPELGVATTVNLFARAGHTLSAFRIAEAWRGHYLLSKIIRIRGVGNRPVSDSAASVFLPDADDIAALPARLPESTALLMYVTGRGEPTTLFVVTRDGVSASTLAPSDSLIGPIGRFSASLEGGSPARQLAASLARQVFGPALDGLAPAVTQLLIVPDGPLYRVPFDALVLAGGKLLVERYATALAPSTRLAARWWTAPPAPPGRRTVIFGDPTFRPEVNLPRLRSSGDEAREIAGLEASPALLLRDDASERALKTRLTGAAILHLATHAEVSDQGLLTSGLELAPGNGEDGHVGVNEIAGLGLLDALVVLSGCRTVGGAVVNGEGLQGLTTPFLEAGARTIVATQWAVGDRTMATLMGGFYRALARGTPVGAALREAKLAALRQGASTRVWASLALVGDPALRPNVF